MTMSVDGLISGMDTTSLVTQLLRAEAAPQTALRTKLTAAETAASAYRTVNTTFAAVRAAAEALTTSALQAARTATSSASNVTASATSAAVDGSSVSFTVTALAKAESQLSGTGWTAPDADVTTNANFTFPMEIVDKDGAVKATITPAAGATLSDVVADINGREGLGLRASVVKLGTNDHRLQVVSTTTGEDSTFTLKMADEDAFTAGSRFVETQAGRDATIELGSGTGLIAKSATNTFADLLPGVSVTVSEVDFAKPVTVTVGQDANSVAGKMKTLTDAVNAALSTVKTYTSNAKGSTAALKGDYPLTLLAGQLLSAVSNAVGADGSPAKIGLQLTKDGKITFDKAKFTTALTEDPALVQRMVGGDDVAAVTGIAGRLFDVAKAASDSTTGSITALATGKDSIAKDLTTRIEAWDVRLARRKETLNRQFTAMETALGSLRNQSTWLAGQINSLPKYS